MSLLYPNYAEVGTGSVGHYRNVPLAIKTVFILFFTQWFSFKSFWLLCILLATNIIIILLLICYCLWLLRVSNLLLNCLMCIVNLLLPAFRLDYCNFARLYSTVRYKKKNVCPYFHSAAVDMTLSVNLHCAKHEYASDLEREIWTENIYVV